MKVSRTVARLARQSFDRSVAYARELVLVAIYAAICVVVTVPVLVATGASIFWLLATLGLEGHIRTVYLLGGVVVVMFEFACSTGSRWGSATRCSERRGRGGSEKGRAVGSLLGDAGFVLELDVRFDVVAGQPRAHGDGTAGQQADAGGEAVPAQFARDQRCDGEREQSLQE